MLTFKREKSEISDFWTGAGPKTLRILEGWPQHIEGARGLLYSRPGCVRVAPRAQFLRWVIRYVAEFEPLSNTRKKKKPATLRRSIGLNIIIDRHLKIFFDPDYKLELARQNRKTKRQSLSPSFASTG